MSNRFELAAWMMIRYCYAKLEVALRIVYKLALYDILEK